jgi:hypothetical protein
MALSRARKGVLIRGSTTLPANERVVEKRDRTGPQAEREGVWRDIVSDHYPPRVLQVLTV